MALTAFLDRSATPSGLRDWIARKIEDRRAARTRRAEYVQLHDELSRMSDADLADIGLSRHGIDDVALGHAYR